MKNEYKAFLLRLQRNQGSDHWRVTIQNAHTGEITRFANEYEMLRFLTHLLANVTDELDSQQLKGQA
ncbi:MAG: hypothetical protein KC423_06555 [Anaerolineales bacterium]|nr:hypothetical protein [Anaerolineales bacterium]